MTTRIGMMQLSVIAEKWPAHNTLNKPDKQSLLIFKQ